MGPEPRKTLPLDDAELVVIRYLREHPDFLSRNPWLLERLELTHACGPASSLVERQLRFLRDRNSHLRHQMASLIGNARDNERFSRKLHDLTLVLIECDDHGAVMDALETRLREEFLIDFVESRFGAVFEADWAHPTTLECGPITPSRWKTLFNTHPFGLRTAVLIPLHTDAGLATLGLGSKDRERFGPDMGTLFWEQLGDTVSAVLHRTGVT
ncbi:MAG: DUF484 family protein [Pseudomonadota bacterium]